jgi:hypothetical protein
MSKNLNSKLKKKESFTCDPSKHGVKGSQVCSDTDHMERGLWTAQITLIIYYQIELDKLNIYETLTCSIPKMCWWLCMRFCIISSCCLSLSSAAQEEQVDEELEV